MCRQFLHALLLVVGIVLVLNGTVFAQPAKRQLSPSEKTRIAEARKLEDASFKQLEDGNYKQAAAYSEQVLKIYESIYGPTHTETSTSLVNLGHVYSYTGRYQDAEELLLRALKIDESSNKNDPKSMAFTMSNLANVYMHQSKFAEAIPLLEKSLAVFEKSFGPESENVAGALANLASALEGQARFREAEPLIKRALAINTKVLGSVNATTGNSRKQLAGLYESQGNFAEAISHYSSAKEVLETVLPTNHPSLAGISNDLACIYVSLGDYDAAKPLLQRALRIREESLGVSHAQTGIVVCNLATLCKEQGDINEAYRLYERAYKVFDESNDTTRRAYCSRMLGDLKTIQEDLVGAERYYRRALDLLESKLGENHPEVSATLNCLAKLSVRSGDWATADSLFRRSLKILEQSSDADHPDIIAAHQNLAILKESTGQTKEAARLFDQAQRSSRRHISRVLPALPELQQTMFLKEKSSAGLFASLSFGLAHLEDTAISEVSANWLINGKAVAFEVLSQRNLLTRNTGDANLDLLVKQLQGVRESLARLAMTTGNTAQNKVNRQNAQKLTLEEQQLTQRLSRSGGLPEQANWVDISEVRAALGEQSAFVDIARIEKLDFATAGQAPTWNRARYAAWFTFGGGKPSELVDLGDAAEVDRLVKIVRDRLSVSAASLEKLGEEKATLELEKDLAILAKKIWEPLQVRLAKTNPKIDDLIISPDGALWLVPWSALPVGNDKKVLIESYKLRFVLSGRDLVVKPVKFESKKPTIVADPDFDLTAKAKVASLEMVFKRPESKAEVRNDITPVQSLLPKVSPLPGTGLEAAIIKPNLEKWAGAKADLFQKQYALERVAKALRNPKLVSFATHGFFLNSQECQFERLDFGGSHDGRSVAIDTSGVPITNPLLRCGLLFAGCNNSDAVLHNDDGILTGFEIVGIDLRGTELVVLSACETGVGEVRNGEGVAGLRQAFQLAGARSVVATLWQIPDRESAQIMSDFFAQLPTQTNASSLRYAQLKHIAFRRQQFGAAHPYYWAAWTVTGYE